MLLILFNSMIINTTVKYVLLDELWTHSYNAQKMINLRQPVVIGGGAAFSDKVVIFKSCDFTTTPPFSPTKMS